VRNGSVDVVQTELGDLEISSFKRQGCPEFAMWWDAHDIRSGVAGQKLLNHPKMGSLRFEYASFRPMTIRR
jgi:MmyB-like transcription regulator ligand binding domain